MYRLQHGDLTAQREDFGHGAVIVMRPATSVDVAAAERTAGELLGGLLTGLDSLDGFGIPGLERGDFRDDQYLLGLSSHITNTLLAEMLAEGWDGFCDEVGNPLKMTRANLSWALLSPVIRQKFEQAAYRDVWAEAAEGNA